MNVYSKWFDVLRVGNHYNTMQYFPGTGGDTFEINFSGGYLDRSHVKAISDDEGQEITITFITTSRVKLSRPISVGSKVLIFRDTPKVVPLALFADGSVLNAINLDRNAKQAVFVAAEMLDRFDTFGSSLETSVSQVSEALEIAQGALTAANAARDVADSAKSTAEDALSIVRMHNIMEGRDAPNAHPADSIDWSLYGLVAGAIASATKSFQVYFRSTANVKLYGAKGDGVTDDTVAIQSALDSGCRNIYFPEGVYMVSNVVIVRTMARVYGDGMWATKIRMFPHVEGSVDLMRNAAYAASAVGTYDDDIFIHDIQLHAQGRKRHKALPIEWGRCLKIGSSKNLKTKRVCFNEGPQHCFDITNRNDSYIGIGHHGVAEGMSYNSIVEDCFIMDWVYDDGLTTHAVKGCVIRNCVAFITEEARAFRRYWITQNGFEIDDGSQDVVVDSCYVYGNNSGTKAFSTACHAKAPATFNVRFVNCVADSVVVGMGFWSDTNTDAVHGTDDWKCRNYVVENFTLHHPDIVPDQQIFPSRFLDTQGSMDVRYKNVRLEMGGRDGSLPKTSVAVINNANSVNVEYDGVTINGVIDTQIGPVYTNAPWFRLSPGNESGKLSSNVRIKNVYINRMGWMDRLIRDIDNHPDGGAVVELGRIEIGGGGSDGRTKAVYVGKAQIDSTGIKAPEGIVRYQIGHSLLSSITNSPGRVRVNYKCPDFVMGGTSYRSLTERDGTQPVPALYFDRYFAGSNPDTQTGKGTVAFRTSAVASGAFVITAHHEDTGLWRPIVKAFSSSNGAFGSWSPVYDNIVVLGEAATRYSSAYFASAPQVTSDARAKDHIEYLTDVEKRVGQKLLGMIRTYKMRDSLSSKGADSRTHVGLIVQEVIKAFEEEGLNPFDYGIVCHDEWEDEWQDIVDEESGDVIDRVRVKEAGDAYSLRYDEAFALAIGSIK